MSGQASWPLKFGYPYTRGQFGGSGYDPISPASQGMKGTDSRYTVRDGDTLAGIAASVWGDSSLWYMIAEANGLSGSEALAAGSSLIVPDKVVNIHNSSKTFEVYDPNRALGDLSPTAAKPPKKANKCGMLGTIMLVAVAIAVTALTYGALGGAALTGLSAIGAGAVAGAAGSIVSQGFGVATGLQDKFSWKGVAMAALGGAVGSGLGGVVKGAGILAGAARGAIGSALTQGIGVAVGLQKKFNFAAVAAAGVGGGVGAWAGGKLGATPLADNNTLSNHMAHAGGGAAGLIASAATRSLVEGSDFGDNLLAGLPDMIGSTIGNMVAYGVSGTGNDRVGSAATAPAEPVPGQGGGQVGSTGTDGDIIVTARRSAESPGYVDYFPEVTSFIFNYDLQTGGHAYAVAKQRARIVQDLAAQANSALPSTLPGYSAVDAIDGTMNGTPDVRGWASSEFELRVLTASNEAAYAAGAYDPNVYAAVKRSLAHNAGLLAEWNAIADRAVWDVVKAGIAPLDTATAAYRMFVNGEYNWENGLTLGGSVLGGVAGVGAKFIGRGGSVGIRGADVTAEGSLPRFTFRGDSRLEAEIFRDGFAPRGSSADLLAHAFDNTRPPSAFVPTSRSFDVASGFADNVYVVRPVNGIDVNRTLGSASPFPLEQEIAIFGRVLPSNVRAVTKPAQGISILNPGYKPR